MGPWAGVRGLRLQAGAAKPGRTRVADRAKSALVAPKAHLHLHCYHVRTHPHAHIHSLNLLTNLIVAHLQILDKKHALLAEENGRLRSQFKLQEEDREYLIKQTVALKKENAALRNQLAAALQVCVCVGGWTVEDGGAVWEHCTGALYEVGRQVAAAAVLAAWVLIARVCTVCAGRAGVTRPRPQQAFRHRSQAKPALGRACRRHLFAGGGHAERGAG